MFISISCSLNLPNKPIVVNIVLNSGQKVTFSHSLKKKDQDLNSSQQLALIPIVRIIDQK